MVRCHSRNAGRVVGTLKDSGDAKTLFSRPSHFLRPSYKSHLVKLSKHLFCVIVLSDYVFSTLWGVKEVPCDGILLENEGPINTSGRTVQPVKNIISSVIFAH